jgi:hypothetical protein
MHMALGRKIVNLVGLRVLDDADEICRIRHVPVMQNETYTRLMRVLIEMVDTACIERRRTTFYAVDHISFID